ncbi:MAG: HEAT repeat domain-containing protein [Planctomycetes bacterium]|nr:HEAT repeat domain-containing protein [Planctomycetota bacterium]
MRLAPIFLAVSLVALAQGCRGVHGYLRRLDDPDPAVRQEAMRAIARRTRGGSVRDPDLRLEVEDRTISALADESGLVRAAALLALPDVAPLQTVPRAVEALGDREYYVRLDALRLLAPRAAETAEVAGALDALTRLLAEDPEHHVRREAARVLGRTGRRETARPLLEAAETSARPGVRRAAIEALVAISGEDHGDDLYAWRQWLEAQGTGGG